MTLRFWRLYLVLAAALICGSQTLLREQALAQNKVRTETIRPPASPDAANKPSAHVTPPNPAGAPEIITDLSLLPSAVARTRERILAAAQSGDLQKLLTVMQMNETMPIFSFSSEKDPIAFWKSNYPDSDGVEVLSILVTILQTGFTHVDKGTPQEMYLWPYFTRMPVKTLTPEQKVELFRIITGSDYKDMLDFGAYSFYRLGIGPDGTWHFFVAGD
jgi:hypothetical protein